MLIVTAATTGVQETPLPFFAQQIHPLPVGILLGCKVEETNVSDDVPLPVLFSLLHPLEEPRPVSYILRDGAMDSPRQLEADFFSDPNEYIISSIVNPPVLITFNSETSSHSVWMLRDTPGSGGEAAATHQEGPMVGGGAPAPQRAGAGFLSANDSDSHSLGDPFNNTSAEMYLNLTPVSSGRSSLLSSLSDLSTVTPQRSSARLQPGSSSAVKRSSPRRMALQRLHARAARCTPQVEGQSAVGDTPGEATVQPSPFRLSSRDSLGEVLSPISYGSPTSRRGSWGPMSPLLPGRPVLDSEGKPPRGSSDSTFPGGLGNHAPSHPAGGTGSERTHTTTKVQEHGHEDAPSVIGSFLVGDLAGEDGGEEGEGLRQAVTSQLFLQCLWTDAPGGSCSSGGNVMSSVPAAKVFLATDVSGDALLCFLLPALSKLACFSLSLCPAGPSATCGPSTAPPQGVLTQTELPGVQAWRPWSLRVAPAFHLPCLAAAPVVLPVGVLPGSALEDLPHPPGGAPMQQLPPLVRSWKSSSVAMAVLTTTRALNLYCGQQRMWALHVPLPDALPAARALAQEQVQGCRPSAPLRLQAARLARLALQMEDPAAHRQKRQKRRLEFGEEGDVGSHMWTNLVDVTGEERAPVCPPLLRCAAS